MISLIIKLIISLWTLTHIYSIKQQIIGDEYSIRDSDFHE